MKIKNYFLSLAAVALVAGFASCSNEEIVPGTDPVGPETPEAGIGNDGVAYMKLAINMPMGGGAQGRANNDYEDGDDNEFVVENAILVLFSAAAAADEDDAILRSAYTLKQTNWGDDSNAQITVNSTVTTRVFTANIPTGHNVYAYVILNKHDFFEVKAVSGQDYSTLVFNGTQDLMGKDFKVVRTLELQEYGKDFLNQSFTMTNMPHMHVSGGSGSNAPTPVKPWILVKANKSNVYPTEAAALGGKAAAEIDVERVVAKVQVSASLNEVQGETTGTIRNEDGQPQFTLLGWIVDNVNQKATLSRNSAEPVVAQDANPFAYLAYHSTLLSPADYRFVANAPIHAETTPSDPLNPESTPFNVYRTFWAVDNNYNADATDLFTRAGTLLNTAIQKFDPSHNPIGGDLRPFIKEGSSKNFYYCAENTFDTKHQTVKNTTRVVVAAQFNNGQDFFTLSSDPNKIYVKATIEQYIKDQILNRVNVRNWLADYVKVQGKELTDDIQRKLFDCNVTNTGAEVGKAIVVWTLNSTEISNYLGDIADKSAKITAIQNAYNVIAADQLKYIHDNITDQLSYYKDGVAYYQALIKHFGDSETPWNPETHIVGGNNVENIYDFNDAEGGDKRYLGRYGVVRNNWYDMKITQVSRIGSSVVPPLTDDPDDTVEQYVKVKINIMPWAMRRQNVIL